MGSTVKVIAKRVKGRVFYYPTGDTASFVLTLIKKKTLSELELDALKGLGCVIERISEGISEDGPAK